MAIPPSVTDPEDMFSVLTENGGVGEFEAAGLMEVERFAFPRFPGADKIGTCSAKLKAHKGKHEETAKCLDFEPDMMNVYLSRAGSGPYESDVQTVAGWLDAPRQVVGAVLLLGEPGCGKTALIEAASTYMEAKLFTHICTPDDTRDSMFLRFVGEGHGDGGTAFAKGVVPTAVQWAIDHPEQVTLLYMDEFYLLVDGVKPIFYSIMDGRKFLPGGNVDGSAMAIPDNFRIVLSANPQVRGASLPEPIGSRCASTTLTVETSEQMLVDLGIDEGIISAWVGLGQSNLWRPQIRELRAADYWLDIDINQSVSAFLPEHAPESQRKEIRDTVVGFLGGDVRDDGRLVVS